MAKQPILFCDDGSEIELPSKWVICSCCDGHGKSSAYLGAFTRDDLDDEGIDFQEDYFAGRYDRACDDCGGTGKVLIADYERMTPDQRAAYDDQCRIDREDRETTRMERLMEGGWREEGWFGRG